MDSLKDKSNSPCMFKLRIEVKTLFSKPVPAEMCTQIHIVYTMNTTLLWWAEREGVKGVKVVCHIIFLIFHIQKAVELIIGLKLNIRNMISITMLHIIITHYYLQKVFRENLQVMF